ncbi:MAG: hypothetical protein FOGNACKC_02064 [Anaerolineae bacterium]|nr:hypothetical protein [Anaerolineae bacterium]
MSQLFLSIDSQYIRVEFSTYCSMGPRNCEVPR